MKNNMNSMKNKITKEVKKEIKEINSSIDDKLFIILDSYQNIAKQADEFYLKILQINEEINLLGKNFINKSELDKYINQANIIIDDLKIFRSNLIENELLNNKLKDTLKEDLCKLKCIELGWKKIDPKMSILCGSISVINICKKIDDFCNLILNDFKENYEEKIYDIYKHIKNSIKQYEVKESFNISSTNSKILSIPTIYKNKKLNCKDLSKIALENDFILSRHNGDHDIFKHKENNKIVVIPYKGSTVLAPKTQQSILNMIFA